MKHEFNIEDTEALTQPKNYGAFVEAALKELGFKPKHLCGHFDMSVPSVERYIAGVSMPVPPLRAMVVDHLVQMLLVPQDLIDRMYDVRL